MLPTKKSEVVTDLSSHSALIYGPPKVGKSTFCSQIPDALFLATERGLDSLSVYQANIGSWAEFIEAAKELKEGKHKFKSIVIDTFDNLYHFCSEHVCEQNGIKHPGDLDNNKGYSIVNSTLRRTVARLALLPYGLFIVSHSKTTPIKTRTGKYDRVVPALTGGATDIVINQVSMILYATVEEDEPVEGEPSPTPQRIIRTDPSKYWIAGDRTGRLPAVFPLSYQEFVKAFNGGAK